MESACLGDVLSLNFMVDNACV